MVAKIINIETVYICSSNEILWIKTHIYGLIIDPHNHQLLVGVIAQLMEHCAGIAEVWVRVPFRPEFSNSFLLANNINLENVSIGSSYEMPLIETRRQSIKNHLKNAVCRSNDSLSWNNYTISSLFSANEVIIFTNCSFSLFSCLFGGLFIFCCFFLFSFLLFCFVFFFVRFWKILLPSFPDPLATNQPPESYCRVFL